MAYKKGNVLFYVDGSGNVSTVVAQEDESSGVVSVRYRTGKSENVPTFHLFSTEIAANRAAVNRTKTAKSAPPVRIVQG
jgi:hypothetical protein